MKLRYFTEEWTEWREVGSCRVGYKEAPDEFNFYSILERRCNGSKCEIDLETTYEFCEPINGNWSEWQVMNGTDCFEAESGKWFKIANRSCNNPPPLYFGICEEDIEGNDTKPVLCPPSKISYVDNNRFLDSDNNLS